MTENKSLKRRVRERMSKTGERYTAARRQVLARPALAPTAQSSPAPEALHGPTGRSLSAWFELLDRWGAAERAHPDIARWLNQEQGVDSWWSQDLTVRYEKHIGRRVLGQRGSTFSGTASRTIAVPASAAFAAWLDETERARWLPDIQLRVRTAKPHRTARFDVVDDEGRVVLTFDAKGDSRTTLSIEHEKLPDAASARRWTTFWRERLTALKELLERS